MRIIETMSADETLQCAREIAENKDEKVFN